MKWIFSLCLFGILSLSSAQTTSPEPKPEDTEVWTPVPPVVMAGQYGEPPSDAIILFDGSSLDQWCKPTHPSEKSRLDSVILNYRSASQGPDRGEAPWKIVDGCIEVVPDKGAIETKQSFGSIQLHIEWMSPKDPGKEGQSYSNSGIFLMGLYEIQVLNVYENETYSNGMASAVYKQHIPLANPANPPGEWQAYNIVFNAPEFDTDGSLLKPAYVTVFWNNVLVQNHVELEGPTCFLGQTQYFAHAQKLPLRLQDHGDKVQFRNIWVRELDN